MSKILRVESNHIDFKYYGYDLDKKGNVTNKINSDDFRAMHIFHLFHLHPTKTFYIVTNGSSFEVSRFKPLFE
jgi:hypothetical protein